MTELQFDKKGNNPVFAVGCFMQGLKLLAKPELRAFLIMPLLVNLMIYIGAFVLGIYYVTDLIQQFIPSWLDWLTWLLWPLFFISFLITGFFTFTLLANLIASPFYGKLSAKTMALISGENIEITEQPLTQVLFAELKRLGYLLTRALPLLLIFIIPVVNLIAPVLWALFGAWGAVLEFMAYPLENEGLLFSEQRKAMQNTRLGTLSFGGIVMLGLTLPLLNILVPPAAVIGATIFIYKAKSSASNNQLGDI